MSMRGKPSRRSSAGSFTRREFVVTSLAVGFAAAVRPIRAESVITTDTVGLRAGAVMIPAGGTEIPAYRAMPANAKRAPTVLVVHEIFGVHEHIKDVCRRLAKLGYLAVAPELFARQGDVSKMTNIEEIVSNVVSKVSDAQLMADLDATVAWIGKSGEGNVERVGVTGFCWGGRIVWLYAAHAVRLRAGVAWYGRLRGSASALQPSEPIDVVPALRAPVLGLYGGADTGITAADVEAMRAALKAAGNPSEIIVYPGAPHGFHADYRPSYRPDAAKDGWQRLRSWFQSHGVA